MAHTLKGADGVVSAWPSTQEARAALAFRDNFVTALVLNGIVPSDPENVSHTHTSNQYSFTETPGSPYFLPQSRSASWESFTIVPA